ncbi:hypothetical protein FJT64_024020 [Amphibalanus amphitrite]|uniref:Polycystin cation channel PKD1/PKD2 domain-containing protein n=1 Tax=Amphibalanus amphitrite TaxID=1232801 RepID=A0A6A4WJW3_AMPAM|nr:hypothetical protein FJT64_024020 [Amphibalanus amphitrite]
MWSSIISLILFSIGTFDYDGYITTDRTFGAIFFVTYVFFVMIYLINVMLSIIMAGYEMAMDDMQHLVTKYDVGRRVHLGVSPVLRMPSCALRPPAVPRRVGMIEPEDVDEDEGAAPAAADQQPGHRFLLDEEDVAGGRRGHTRRRVSAAAERHRRRSRATTGRRHRGPPVPRRKDPSQPSTSGLTRADLARLAGRSTAAPPQAQGGARPHVPTR